MDIPDVPFQQRALHIRQAWQCCHCVPARLFDRSINLKAIDDKRVGRHLLLLSQKDEDFSDDLKMIIPQCNLEVVRNTDVVGEHEYHIREIEQICHEEHYQAVIPIPEEAHLDPLIFEPPFRRVQIGKTDQVELGVEDKEELDESLQKALATMKIKKSGPHEMCKDCRKYDIVTYHSKRTREFLRDDAWHWRIVVRMPYMMGEYFEHFVRTFGYKDFWLDRRGWKHFMVADGAVMERPNS